jgi:hypothetical protein
MTAEHAHGIDGGRLAGGCHGIVTRDFEQDACGKPVTTIIDDPEGAWPACTYHAHRWGEGRVIPLADILADTIAATLLTTKAATRASAADAVLAEARQLCCGDNPATHHAASAKHSELMAFAGDLARAVRGL